MVSNVRNSGTGAEGTPEVAGKPAATPGTSMAMAMSKALIAFPPEQQQTADELLTLFVQYKTALAALGFVDQRGTASSTLTRLHLGK
jgi:hypothetical protein